MTTNCTTDEDGHGPGLLDSGPEAPAVSSDAGWIDVTTRDVAPAPFDGGPLPVVCESAPCATSLVTTIARDGTDFGEGYCVLLDDGTVACWGANGAAQLGRGDDGGVADDATPARVVGLSGVTRLDHTCALDDSGSVWCWGTGPFLRDGSGARTTERTPFKLPIGPAKRVAMGEEVACALVDEGVVCWGANTNGQLSPFSSSPASARLPPKLIALPSGAPLSEVLVSKATFVLREDGEALSWGADPPLARVTPLSPDPHPRAMALAGVSSIDLTRESGCATVGGIGYCWGNLIMGALNWLNSRTPLDYALPEPVVAPEPLVRIATTTALRRTDLGDPIVQPQRWCAVAASGSVYCWGFNANGQAGDGTKNHAYEAVKVEGLPAPAVQVKTMPDSTCALLSSGKVYCWGANQYGQLGNGRLWVRSFVPQEVVLP